MISARPTFQIKLFSAQPHSCHGPAIWWCSCLPHVTLDRAPEAVGPPLPFPLLPRVRQESQRHGGLQLAGLSRGTGWFRHPWPTSSIPTQHTVQWINWKHWGSHIISRLPTQCQDHGKPPSADSQETNHMIFTFVMRPSSTWGCWTPSSVSPPSSSVSRKSKTWKLTTGRFIKVDSTAGQLLAYPPNKLSDVFERPIRKHRGSCIISRLPTQCQDHG